MKQPLVSIILPVYNAQSHLARCLSSICAQTYQNLEIIVLNDGSKDQSLPVCEEFRKKDSRIILVDKANSGVSDTRNLGLKLATGEYIQFVDSDDYIDPDYTGHLVAAAEEHHADLVIAPYKMVIPAGASKPEQVLEKLEQALNSRTRAVILNSPNNPSGAVISEEDLCKIAALLQKASEKQGKSIWIIADEPYRELVYGNVQVPYLMNLYRNTLVCYSYSKALSLPGERIGYIALCHEAEEREKVFAAICGAGRALGYVCAPVLFQKMLLSCLDETSDVSSYKENRDLLYNVLCALGFTCVKPDGAFYLFLQAPGGSDRDFCEEAKKLDLLIVPSESFGLPGYARIAYCVSKDTIERSLPAFKKLAEHYGLK